MAYYIVFIFNEYYVKLSTSLTIKMYQSCSYNHHKHYQYFINVQKVN